MIAGSISVSRTALALVALIAAPAAVRAATYEIRFDATWNAGEFPDAFPSGAHFSRLVGGTHDDSVAFWVAGGLASPGIERMAETGATGTLVAEIDAAIDQGSAASSFTGDSLFGLPASTSLQIDVQPSHPLVTLTTMIAPSPDWFVGVSGLTMRDAEGWIGQTVVDLPPYDAGTEQGDGFSTTNPASSPHQPIRMIDEAPLPGAPSLGTFTFTVLPNDLPGDFDLNGQVDAADADIWQASFGALPLGAAMVVDGDANGDGNVAGDDFLDMQRSFGLTLPASRAAVASVPEPSAAALLIAAIAIVAYGRWKRRQEPFPPPRL